MSDKFKKLINSDFGKISKYIIEIPLDDFIEDETLKKIPIFGTIVNLYNLGSTINDKIFANKLIHFLKELEDINPETTQKEIQYIDDSKEYNYKVGDKILEIINRIDSEEKPKIIGRLFKNYLNRNITYYEFLKLSNCVEKLFLYDIIDLTKHNEDNEFIIEISDELESVGLCIKQNKFNIEIDLRNNESLDKQLSIKAVLTELGIKLFKYGLK